MLDGSMVAGATEYARCFEHRVQWGPFTMAMERDARPFVQPVQRARGLRALTGAGCSTSSHGPGELQLRRQSDTRKVLRLGPR